MIFSTPRDAHSRAAPPASPLVGVARFLRVRTRHCLRQLAQGQPAQQEDLPEPEVDRLALLCRDAAAVDSACRVDEAQVVAMAAIGVLVVIAIGFLVWRFG